MKILVIGGNRFFGKKLVAKLLAAQHEVTLLNRQTLDDGFGNDVHRIKCDRQDKAALRSAINDNYDVVYDQVCYSAQDARDACEIFDGKTSHYVLTSTQSVYKHGTNLTEEDFLPKNHQFVQDADPKADYAEAKRQCEAELFQRDPFPITAIRFTFVVGEDDYTQRLKWHVDRVKNSEAIHVSNLEAEIPLIHSTDAAEVLFSLGTKMLAGTFNASAPNPIKLSQLLIEVQKAVGKKAVLGGVNDPKAHSPYGVDHSWFMSIAKLEAANVHPRKIDEWLHDLLITLRDAK